MKLKTFSQNFSKKDLSPVITAHFKTGLFRLSSGACKMMEVKDGSCIAIHQDNENPADWYLEVLKADGIKLREKDTNGLLFNCTSAIQSMMDEFSWEGVSMSCKISLTPNEETGVKLWCILTKGAIIRRSRNK